MIIGGGGVVIRELLQVNHLSQAVVHNFSVAWLGSVTFLACCKIVHVLFVCLKQVCRFDLSVVWSMKLLFFHSFEVHSFKFRKKQKKTNINVIDHFSER